MIILYINIKNSVEKITTLLYIITLIKILHYLGGML